MESAPKDSSMGKWLLALVMLGLVVAFFATGTHRQFDAQRVNEGIRAFGDFGPLVFVLAFALLQPLGPSGHIFIVAASLVWSAPVAFGLSLVGAVASQVTGFAFYRYVASDWARARIPARLWAYEDRIITKPIRNIIVLRLVMFTWQVSPMLLGVSRVRFLPMLVGTTIGLVPGVALDVFIGATVLDFFMR